MPAVMALQPSEKMHLARIVAVVVPLFNLNDYLTHKLINYLKKIYLK